MTTGRGLHAAIEVCRGPYARVADGVGSAHGSETLLQHACARETPAAVHLFGNAHIIVHCPAPRQGATG